MPPRSREGFRLRAPWSHGRIGLVEELGLFTRAEGGYPGEEGRFEERVVSEHACC